MFRRCGVLSLLAMTLTMCGGCAYETFCALRDGIACDYQSRHWMGSPGCGPVYFNEWSSDPPACCEPCNQCGYFAEGGCCLRSRLRQRRQSFFNSLLGRSDCYFGHYALDGCQCGGIDGAGYSAVGRDDDYVTAGCGGCNGGGFALGFHYFVNRVLNFGTGRGCECGCEDGDCGPGGPASGCGHSPTGPAPAPGPGAEATPSRREPTPAEELPPPPPASMQQSKRTRVVKPAVYRDAFDDVFDDGEQPRRAGVADPTPR